MIFVDTGAFFALLDSSSRDHAVIDRLFRELRARRETLLTTNAVAYETHARSCSRGPRAASWR